MPTFECMSGQSDSHVRQFEYGSVKAVVHPELEPALKILADAAKKQGFELKVVSCYRSFEQQLAIWNAKATGKRPVLDILERPIRHGTLSGWSLVEAMLRWSALPGTSRHHWGCDLDVVDGAALKGGYKVQLTQKEAAADGVFGAFHQWLTGWLAQNPEVGFTRPYHQQTPAALHPKQFGIAPEPWHLSYQPVAAQCEIDYNSQRLAELLERTNIELKRDILLNLDEIIERFVKVHT